jgi:hypothetical protein
MVSDERRARSTGRCEPDAESSPRQKHLVLRRSGPGALRRRTSYLRSVANPALSPTSPLFPGGPSPLAQPCQMSPLVPDVADRNAFGVNWHEVTVGDVGAFLASTHDDEPLHWEAKSGRVTPEHVRHPVTAFANREDGDLNIGAQRDAQLAAWACRTSISRARNR